MAIRPQYSVTDKSSTVLGVAGAALAAELATQAYPESGNKRQWFNLRTVVPAQGATPAEAFIDGIQGFRFRLAADSVCIIKVLATIISTTSSNNAGFEMTFVAQNVGGVLAIQGTPLTVKYPAATVSNVAFTVDNLTQSLVCSTVGSAGTHQWDIRIAAVSEVTDIG